MRGVVLDEAVRAVASLVPVPDAPIGSYEASRSGEIARWQGTLGQSVMFAIQREVKIVTLHLTRLSFETARVMPALTDAVLKATCTAAFPDDAGLLVETGRYHDAALVSRTGDRTEPRSHAERERRSRRDDVRAEPAPFDLEEELGAAALVIKTSAAT